MVKPHQDVTFCRVCRHEAQRLYLDNENWVAWCEEGHVTVCDPDLPSPYKLVWNFHDPTRDQA